MRPKFAGRGLELTPTMMASYSGQNAVADVTVRLLSSGGPPLLG
jgi:hypothetical protein